MLRRYLLLALVAVGVMPNVYGMKRPVSATSAVTVDQQARASFEKSLETLLSEVNTSYRTKFVQPEQRTIITSPDDELNFRKYYKQLSHYNKVQSAYESAKCFHDLLKKSDIHSANQFAREYMESFFDLLTGLRNNKISDDFSRAIFGLKGMINDFPGLLAQKRSALKEALNKAEDSLLSLREFVKSHSTQSVKMQTIIREVQGLVKKFTPQIQASGIENLKLAKSSKSAPVAATSSASSSTSVPAVNPIQTPTPSTSSTETISTDSTASASDCEEKASVLEKIIGTENNEVINDAIITVCNAVTDVADHLFNDESNDDLNIVPAPVTPVVQDEAPAAPIALTSTQQLEQMQQAFDAQAAECVALAKDYNSVSNKQKEVAARISSMVQIVEAFRVMDVKIKLAQRWSSGISDNAKSKFTNFYEKSLNCLKALSENLDKISRDEIITPVASDLQATSLSADLDKALLNSSVAWIVPHFEQFEGIAEVSEKIQQFNKGISEVTTSADVIYTEAIKDFNEAIQELNVYEACATPGLCGANRNLIAKVASEKKVQFPAPDKNSVPQSDLTKRLLVQQARIAQVLLQQEHALNQIKKNQPAEQGMYRDIEQQLEKIATQAFELPIVAAYHLKSLSDMFENNPELKKTGLFNDSTAGELENIRSTDYRNATYQNLKQQIEKTIKGIQNLEQKIIIDVQNNPTLLDKAAGFVADHSKALVAATVVIGLGLAANYCGVMPEMPSWSDSTADVGGNLTDVPGVCPVPTTLPEYRPHSGSLLAQMFDPNGICEAQPQTPVQAELMLQSPAELECPAHSAVALIPGEDVVTHSVVTTTPMERSMKLASYEDVTQVPSAAALELAPTEIKTTVPSEIVTEQQQPVTTSPAYVYDAQQICAGLPINASGFSYNENHELGGSFDCSLIPVLGTQGFQPSTPVLPGNTESAQAPSMTTMLNSLPSFNVLPTYEHLKTGLTGLTVGGICWSIVSLVAQSFA